MTETLQKRDQSVMTWSQSCGYSQATMNGLQHTSAFVIQFRAGVADGSDELSGRIEHVASGRTETFQSIREVPAVLQRMVSEWEGKAGHSEKGEAKVKRHLAGSLLLMV